MIKKILNPKFQIQSIWDLVLWIWSFPPQKGFTLIELLVVIGISALSMAILFPNFMGARMRARDSLRKRQLLDVQKALELYKLDQNPQAYPTAGAFQNDMCGTCWSSDGECEGAGNIYIKKFPCDPGGSPVVIYIYSSGSDNLTYKLSACLENSVDPDRDLTTEPLCSDEGLSSFTIEEP